MTEKTAEAVTEEKVESIDRCNTSERKICTGLGMWLTHQDETCSGASYMGFAPMVTLSSGDSRTCLVVSIQHHKAWTDLTYCPFCGSDIREGFGKPGEEIKQASQETYDRLLAEYEKMKADKAAKKKAWRKEERDRKKAQDAAMKERRKAIEEQEREG